MLIVYVTFLCGFFVVDFVVRISMRILLWMSMWISMWIVLWISMWMLWISKWMSMWVYVWFSWWISMWISVWISRSVSCETFGMNWEGWGCEFSWGWNSHTQFGTQFRYGFTKSTHTIRGPGEGWGEGLEGRVVVGGLRRGAEGLEQTENGLVIQLENEPETLVNMKRFQKKTLKFNLPSV